MRIGRKRERLAPPCRLAIDPAGLVSIATQIASPNCDDRPPDTSVTLIVIHGISLPPGHFAGSGVARLFTNSLDPAAHPYYAAVAHLKVSSHFFIRRDGTLVQFVPCDRRAWHAGQSSWNGLERCNDFSIGIELEGTDDRPYRSPQYRTLARLIVALRQRYGSLDLAGHSDVAPGRKTDPGPAFNWARLQRLSR